MSSKKIFFRVFPTETFDFDHIKLDSENNMIYVRHLQEISKNNISKEKTYWEFPNNGVFFNTTQEDLYKEVADGILKKVMNGDNGVILGFGQTGSGKTFTLSGLHLNEEGFGIVPRIILDLFELKKQEPKNIKISIQISYLEFYNTYAVDLLQQSPNVIESSKCRNVRRINVPNEFEALKCIFIAEGRKNFVESCKYLSNVATSVVTFYIIRKNMDLSNPTKTCSRLHIIDLAGNETCAKLAQKCKNSKEIGLANVMKSQLEQFILCLMENIPENIRVKQRTNALFYYLNKDFSHESILRFIGHIKIKNNDILVTLSMLRFGHLIQELKMRKKPIEFEINEETELEYLRNKLKAIEKENCLNSILLNQDLVSALDSERIDHLNRTISDYIADKITEIKLMNVTDTELVLQNIKGLCKNLQNDLATVQEENKILLISQQKSELSLKEKRSKSNSQLSGTKLSRKSSKVASKESTTASNNGRNKRDGGISTDSTDKPIKTSGISATEISISMSLSSSQKRKKSNKSSTSGFKSGQSKRKSSNTSIDKKESRSSIDTQIPLPDILPEKQDLWKKFVNDGNVYKENLEEYKENEKEIRNIYTSYIREVKQLQNCKEAVEKHSNDLFAAQTYRKFNADDEYDDGELILSYAEKECSEHLEEAKFLLVDQQERILTLQEALKVHLKNRKIITKKTEIDFDNYCKENQYPFPDDSVIVQNVLNTYTVDTNLNKPLDELEEEKEISCIPDMPRKSKILRDLQKIMEKELEFRKNMKNRTRTWKNF